MVLNEHLVKHIDAEIFELVKLLEITQKPKVEPTPREMEGSMALRAIEVNFSLKYSYVESDGETIKQCDPTGECIGWNEANFKRFQKLVNALYEEQHVNQLLSRKFIEDLIFNWSVETRKNNVADGNFSSHFLSITEDAIETYNIYFPMLYFETMKPFTIGRIVFDFFTPEYFDKLIKSAPDADVAESYFKLKGEYVGKCYAMCSLKIEKERGKEMAFYACSFAVDILKICSHTLDVPEHALTFDIDKRISHTEQSEMIVEVVSRSELQMNLDRGGRRPFQMDQKQFDYFQSRGLQDFNKFVLALPHPQTELQEIICHGIQRLALALSNKNLTKRVTEIFTLLESLLLVNDNSVIIDTVCTYSSKLIAKKVEDRKQIIKLLKEMYGVRSSYIHHAKSGKFEMLDLARLQRIAHHILLVFIQKSKTHATKHSILSKIDDAIIEAY